MPAQAFVSVVTPVYNGARFLVECVESVLAQSHGNLEYVILDNASTDDTAAILERYRLRDPRIRVFRNDATLWVIDNWNSALERISPDSRYCKILHADDTMQPDCIERLVAVGERHPSVGVLGSPRMRGDIIECEGLPRGQECFDGRQIAARFLRQEVFALAPSSAMFRSDLVRARRPFYPSEFLHADLAVTFELLGACDFGFVDEVLSFSRTHSDSITATVAEKRRTLFAEWLPMLRRYGPALLPADQLEAVEAAFLKRYYRLIVRGFLTRREPGFMDYHLDALRKLGRLPGVADIALALAAEAGASVANPGKAFRQLAEGFNRRPRRPLA